MPDFRFAAHYKGGITNTVVDALSQAPIELEQNQTERISTEEVTAILSPTSVQMKTQEPWVAILNGTIDIKEGNTFTKQQTLDIKYWTSSKT